MGIGRARLAPIVRQEYRAEPPRPYLVRARRLTLSVPLVNDSREARRIKHSLSLLFALPPKAAYRFSGAANNRPEERICISPLRRDYGRVKV